MMNLCNRTWIGAMTGVFAVLMLLWMIKGPMAQAAEAAMPRPAETELPVASQSG